MDEMKHFTKDIVQKIKSSEQKYKHDNLTTTECPTCGKFMIKVKLKWTNVSLSGSFMQNEEENIQRKTNARCPNCKKNDVIW